MATKFNGSKIGQSFYVLTFHETLYSILEALFVNIREMLWIFDFIKITYEIFY